MGNLKNLNEICLENGVPCFSYCWLGNHYCGLSHEENRKIDCQYFGEQDHNEKHTCQWYEEMAKKILDSEVTIAQIKIPVNQN